MSRYHRDELPLEPTARPALAAPKRTLRDVDGEGYAMRGSGVCAYRGIVNAKGICTSCATGHPAIRAGSKRICGNTSSTATWKSR
jgi:hypothetical protein